MKESMNYIKGEIKNLDEKLKIMKTFPQKLILIK